jgi:hypothetical protein
MILKKFFIHRREATPSVSTSDANLRALQNATSLRELT